jgi:hypothetical protein
MTDLVIGGRKVRMKVDTGAAVTVMDARWRDRIKHTPTQGVKSLNGPDGTPLETVAVGKAQIALGKTIEAKVYFVKNLRTPLLGMPEIRALGLHPCWKLAELAAVTEQPLWTIPGEYNIELEEGAKPHAEFVPRKVPLPLYDEVKRQLETLDQQGIIRKMTEPTDWCAGMVTAQKADGGVRICVDLTKLNRFVKTPHFPIEGVETTIARLGTSGKPKFFSKLDAYLGFHQIQLSEASQPLTTFITPFGRYCYNRLPFGLTSAPEYYQRRITEIVGDIEGVVVRIDDIIVAGSTEEEHDDRLRRVIKRLNAAGVTLNLKKCHFKVPRVKFLGQMIDGDGVHADPDKVRALTDMKPPSNVTEVRSLLGLANQLAKFVPHLADTVEPIRRLLTKDAEWIWDKPQQEAFQDLKKLLTTAPTLALYDCHAPTKVSVDASSYGLGGVILQQNEGEWKPIAYASRAMSEAERRYAQIEKECLAMVWGVEKFSEFLRGMPCFVVETDHKPLVPLFSGNKSICDLPLRLQRFAVRLMPYRFDIRHVPGKTHYAADHFSRNPVASVAEISCVPEVAKPVWPATNQRLRELESATKEDPVLGQVAHYVVNGWPLSSLDVPERVRPFYQFRNEILMEPGGLLTFRDRIVIPAAMRLEILNLLHRGHAGVKSAQMRARTAVWWPGLTQQLEGMILSCAHCMEKRPVPTEPMQIKPIPDGPWKKVGMDLFYLKSAWYLLLVDYYSKFLEVQKMESITSEFIIVAMKQIFGRHGIPEVVVSDNGPQFASAEMGMFAKEYGFEHVFTAPYNPRENGQAERFVKIAKDTLKGSKDPTLSLMMLRATPSAITGKSPAELMFGRRIRTPVPQLTRLLRPTPTEKEDKEIDDNLMDKLMAAKMAQKRYHDKRHRATPLTPCQKGQRIRDRVSGKEGVVEAHLTDHTYAVAVGPAQTKTVRNRRHIEGIPEE